MKQDIILTDAAWLLRLFGAMQALRVLQGEARLSDRDFFVLTALQYPFVQGAAMTSGKVPLLHGKISPLQTAYAPVVQILSELSTDTDIKAWLPCLSEYVNSGFTAIPKPPTASIPAASEKTRHPTNSRATVIDFRTRQVLTP